MRRAARRVLAALLAALLAAAAGATDILIVRSARPAAYDAAVRAFSASLGPAASGRGPKQALLNIRADISLSDPGAPEAFARALRAHRPDLVLALGGAALAALGDLEDVPVVHLFAANASALTAGRSNVVGLPLEVPPASSLDALLAVAPAVRRVGIVHDPGRSARFVADARAAAAARGVSVKVREAASASEVPGLLESLRGEVDAVWMVPDLTVTTPETVEALMTFSLAARLPVLTFADKYLDLGAAVAVTLSPEALGEQAAALARQVLAGVPASQAKPREGLPFKVRLNPAVLGNLGLPAGRER